MWHILFSFCIVEFSVAVVVNKFRIRPLYDVLSIVQNLMRFLCKSETTREKNCWEGFGFPCTPSPPSKPWQVEHFWLLTHPAVTFTTSLSHTSEHLKVLIYSCWILWTGESILVLVLSVNWCFSSGCPFKKYVEWFILYSLIVKTLLFTSGKLTSKRLTTLFNRKVIFNCLCLNVIL